MPPQPWTRRPQARPRPLTIPPPPAPMRMVRPPAPQPTRRCGFCAKMRKLLGLGP